MTTTDTTTRRAPGDTNTPYDLPGPDRWAAVIYYPVGEVERGEGKIWLVEPFPAARADASDGLDFDYMGEPSVAVLRGDAAPRPRGASRDGDWIVPGKALAKNCAYDTRAADQADLLVRWTEAYAIAAALNAGVKGIKPEDVEVLLAAERCQLVADSRFAGTINELRWTRPGGTTDGERVPVRQARRLRQQLHLIEARKTIDCQHARKGEFSSAGADWIETTYGLTIAGHQVLAEIRAYARPTRTVRYAVDSKTPSNDWAPYSEGTVETAETDPNAIARTVAVNQGIPPGAGALIAWNATVRVRVWTNPDTGPGAAPDGEYVHEALAKRRDEVARRLDQDGPAPRDVRDEMPPDQGLVTEAQALALIAAGGVRLGEGCSYSVDNELLPDGVELIGPAGVQLMARLYGAVDDGYAECVGDPDEDGDRQLAITPAGALRLGEAGIASAIAVAKRDPAGGGRCNCLHHQVGGFPYPCRNPS